MTETQRRWREKRVLDIGACDVCQGAACLVHEIARGCAHRPKALDKVFATLILCGNCHDLKVHKGMTVAEQLAWLHHRRPEESDLQKFWELTGRMWPDNSDVWQHVLKIRATEDGLRSLKGRK